MSGRYGFAALVGLVGLWLAARDAAAQKVYKWTDPNGKVHFSNVSPEGESSTQEPAAPAPQGIEAQAPAGEGAEPSAPPSGSDSSAQRSGAHSDLSEDQFSAQVSTTRMHLKRELSQVKQQSQEAGDKLAELKKERDEPTRMGIELLQKAYGPEEHASSEEEDLRKQKEKADRRADEIRKQYGDLKDEAVKRFGHQPSWWLPIE
jgi:hypothetical protein